MDRDFPVFSKVVMNKFLRFSFVSAPLAFLATRASATTGDGISAALGAVDLTGVVTLVGAAALVVVAIALVFKGPDIAKRVIRKV